MSIYEYSESLHSIQIISYGNSVKLYLTIAVPNWNVNVRSPGCDLKKWFK